jgi:uncharacterized protein
MQPRSLQDFAFGRVPPIMLGMASVMPHLLVDGSNVLHAWPELAALMRRDRNAARARLVRAMSRVHDAQAMRVTLVFDGRGQELMVERPSDDVPTFSILTTPAGVTADDIIERLVAQGSDPAACVVATADGGVRETVTAAGASVIDPAELAAWVTRAEQQTNRQVDRANARTRKRFDGPDDQP